jgi:hypothetical protein
LAPDWHPGCTTLAHVGVQYFNCAGQMIGGCSGAFDTIVGCGAECGVDIICDPDYATESAWAQLPTHCNPDGLPPIPGTPTLGQIISFDPQAPQCCVPPP